MYTTELCATTDGQLSTFPNKASKMHVHTQTVNWSTSKGECIYLYHPRPLIEIQKGVTKLL